jgi:hypothetical protein
MGGKEKQPARRCRSVLERARAVEHQQAEVLVLVAARALRSRCAQGMREERRQLVQPLALPGRDLRLARIAAQDEQAERPAALGDLEIVEVVVRLRLHDLGEERRAVEPRVVRDQLAQRRRHASAHELAVARHHVAPGAAVELGEVERGEIEEARILAVGVADLVALVDPEKDVGVRVGDAVQASEQLRHEHLARQAERAQLFQLPRLPHEKRA